MVIFKQNYLSFEVEKYVGPKIISTISIWSNIITPKGSAFIGNICSFEFICCSLVAGLGSL